MLRLALGELRRPAILMNLVGIIGRNMPPYKVPDKVHTVVVEGTYCSSSSRRTPRNLGLTHSILLGYWPTTKVAQHCINPAVSE